MEQRNTEEYINTNEKTAESNYDLRNNMDSANKNVQSVEDDKTAESEK